MAVTFDGSVFNENDPLISGIDMHTDALVLRHSHCGDEARAIHPGDIMEIFIWELRILIRTQGRVPTPPTLRRSGRSGLQGIFSEIYIYFFLSSRRHERNVWDGVLAVNSVASPSKKQVIRSGKVGR